MDTYLAETRGQIRRLARATEARRRCDRKARRAAVRGTEARTPAGQAEWFDLSHEYRRSRDAWDREIRDLRRQLRG